MQQWLKPRKIFCKMMYQIIKQQALTLPERNLLLLLSPLLPLLPSPSLPFPIAVTRKQNQSQQVILKPVDLCAGGRVRDAIKILFYFILLYIFFIFFFFILL